MKHTKRMGHRRRRLWPVSHKALSAHERGTPLGEDGDVARALRKTTSSNVESGGSVRLASRHGNALSATLVLIVLVAAFAVPCPDGVHTSRVVSDACAAMTHSTALGVASDSSPTLLVVSVFAVAIAGLAAMLGTASSRPMLIGPANSPRPSADSLNGRLRL